MNDRTLSGPHDWFEGLQRLGLSQIERKQPRGDIFIDVVIEGQRFRGRLLGNSLYVCSARGACALGSGVLAASRRAPAEWAIWFGEERAVNVFLSPEGRRSLALEFGLPIVSGEDAAPAGPAPAAFFYASRGFTAIQAWLQDHPRYARGVRGDKVLGDWPGVACGRHGGKMQDLA